LIRLPGALCWGQFLAITAIVGPPTCPAPMQSMFANGLSPCLESATKVYFGMFCNAS
jgi:hypothetical protein